MRFAIAAAAIVAGASAEYGYGYPPAVPVNSTSAYPVETPSSSAYVPVVVTKTVSEYETYCPGPTTITEGSSTYTVTEATTITIPCGKCVITTTESYPTITASSVPSVPTTEVEVPSYPTSEVPAPAPYPTAGNGTVPSSYPTGTGAVPAPSNPPTEFPGSASQMGVGMLAVVGAIAAFL